MTFQQTGDPVSKDTAGAVSNQLSATADGDKPMEIAIGNMLRIGVLFAAVTVLTGGILFLRKASPAVPNYAHFTAVPASLRTVQGVMRGLRAFDPASIIELGILFLIATPILRVVLCVFGFARQRDLLYTAISALVLAILTFSLLHTSSH